MGTHSVNEFSHFVNQQFDPLELINAHLAKAIALCVIVTHSSLSDCPEQMIQDYLWVLQEHIEKAYACNTRVLEAFLGIVSQQVGAAHAEETNV